ncbi:MAG: bifunctional adenosylcobinamide kinase/adenosylcobinamide-phosphate guanylyltransferase [Desulfobacterales bacterium]
MQDKILIIGGCRSGKSSHALRIAEEMKGKKIFIATCIPYDDEMKKRVDNHQRERSSDWETVEAPLDLPQAISECANRADVVLADCLTLWISNLMMEETEEKKMVMEIDRLVHSLKNAPSPVIMVSNEVGAGIVPENLLARSFRDSAGFVNQKVAATSNRVIWMVAGIPVVIKNQS